MAHPVSPTVVGLAAPLVVVSHLPGEQPFQPARFAHTLLECVDDHDYWHGITAAWAHAGPLVIVEHDMECSDDLIGELVDCPHPVCTFAYTLYWVSTGGEAHYAQRTAAGFWLRENQEWADYSGIGLCKIAARARGPLVPYGHGDTVSHWAHVDIAVNNAVTARWHVHWPEVDHAHV